MKSFHVTIRGGNVRWVGGDAEGMLSGAGNLLLYRRDFIKCGSSMSSTLFFYQECSTSTRGIRLFPTPKRWFVVAKKEYYTLYLTKG